MKLKLKLLVGEAFMSCDAKKKHVNCWKYACQYFDEILLYFQPARGIFLERIYQQQQNVVQAQN